MATFQISGPGGEEYEIDAPDEGAALKAFQGLSQAPKAAPAAPSLAGAANSILGAAKDVGRSFESGADIGGVAGLVGLPNAAMHFVDRTVLAPAAQAIVRATGRVPASDMPGGDKRPTIADGFPSPEAVTRSMEQVTGPAYKPQTTVGEVAHTLGEFAPNALAGGAGAALRAGETAAQTAARVAAKRSDLLGKGTVTQVVAPALASEGAGRAAREVSPDMEAPARLVGALAGGVGAAVAQAPRGASAVREGLEGFSAEQLAAAQALRAEARALPGGGIELPLDEALNQVTGGQASRLSQLARVVANSGGEGQRIASEVYSARPGQIEAAGRAAFDGLAEKSTSPTALGGAVQDAARAGLAETPQGMALTEARVAAGPRVTPEQAGQIIQPELRRAYDRREGMRAALAEPEYDAARQAPETVGIERTIEVERPGEPIVTQPVYSRPRFDDGAPRPAEPFTPPAAEATGPAGKSLARFIAENGGLRLDGDAAATDLHRYVVPGVGKVARPDGKGLDNFWRERLIEEGYFRPDADGGMARDIGPELLRKLQNEQRGFPSYPLDGPGRAQGRGAMSRSADEYDAVRSTMEGRLDEDLTRAGVPPASLHPDIRERVVGALMRGEDSDPLQAYERTVGAMKGPLDPYVKSTTVREEIPDVRFGQVNPQGVLDHVNGEMRSAKGPVLLALQQARKMLFQDDGKTLDLSVAGLHGAREAINDLIGKAEPTTQRALMGVRNRLDQSLSSVPEYEYARSGFENASRNLDPFEGGAPGRIVAQDQASGRFAMAPERAPLAIDKGPSAGRAFNEVASPEARTAYEGHLTTSLLDKATDAATGDISVKALRKAMRANEDQLAQFPDVRERLSNIAVAREGMAAVERLPLGQVAEKPDAKRAIAVLFDRDPLAGGEGEISSAMSALAKNDAVAAKQLARVHLETVFDDAVTEKRGLAAQYGGAGFASGVAGQPQQRKNLEAAIKALPDGDVLWGGLDRFLTVLKATGYRPQKGSDTAFNAKIQDELKGGGGVGGAVANVVAGGVAGGAAAGVGGAGAGGLLGLKRSASDAYTRYQIGRNGEAVARMLFDPKALPDLRHLVKAKPGSKNEEFFTSRLLALAGSGSAPGDRGQRKVP